MTVINSETEAPSPLGNASLQPALIAISEKEAKIIQRIASSPVVLRGPDAYADVGENFGKRALRSLEQRGLLHRPNGPKSGYVLTDAGRDVLKRAHELAEAQKNRATSAP